MFHWLEIIQQVMGTLGLFGIGLLMFLECVFPPIPSEIILPFAGLAANNGQLPFIGIVIASTLGSLAGALVLYYLGRLLGTERLVVLADKYGKWLMITGKDIRKADKWFDRYGTYVVFFCRFVPGIRSLVSIPAGVSEMKLLPFVLYTTIGTALWNALLIYLGFLLKQNFELVDQYLGPISTGVFALIALAIVVWFVMRFRERKTLEKSDTTPNPEQPHSPIAQQNFSSTQRFTQNQGQPTQQPWQQQPQQAQQQPWQQQPQSSQWQQQPQQQPWQQQPQSSQWQQQQPPQPTPQPWQQQAQQQPWQQQPQSSQWKQPQQQPPQPNTWQQK